MNRTLSVPFFIKYTAIIMITVSLLFFAAGSLSVMQKREWHFSVWPQSIHFPTSELIGAMGWENPYLAQNLKKDTRVPSLPSRVLLLSTSLNLSHLQSFFGLAIPGFSLAEMNHTTTLHSSLVTESAPPLGVITQERKKAELALQPLQKHLPKGNQSLINPLLQSGSYYQVKGQLLWHTISAGSFIYGPAPEFLSQGKKYYSMDGHTFYNHAGKKTGTAYQYFEILPLNTKTSYSAKQLDQYIQNHIPQTYKRKMNGAGPLAHLGSAFIAAQNQYGVNALYLLAHAIHESAWGSSQIAQDKDNLFGFGAVDSNPYNGAMKFSTFQACIDYVAQYVDQKYQDPNGAYYYGDMLGNKDVGMNVKYASDPFWGQEIAGLMFQIDQSLGGKDFGKYDSGKYHLAISTTKGKLNARTLPTVADSNIQYHYKSPGNSMIVLNQVGKTNGTWYQIYSDESNFLHWKKAYVYHDGKMGQLSKIVAVAGVPQ